MRVLVANKFWYRRGGLERVMFDEIAWLEDAGHEVAHFSTSHPANTYSPWSRFFAPYLELGSGNALSMADKATAAVRMFSNREAAQRVSSLIAEFRPDLMHVHGLHRQLSPSVLFAARRAGVPVVQTLHDYHHVCPADVLLRGGQVVCEPRRCGTYGYGAAVRNRCVRGSCAASAVSAAETSFQRLRRAYERTVRRFISPSRFVAGVMRDGGWSVPCDVIPNAVPLGERADSAGYALFAGRLSPEKGIDSFLRAAAVAGIRAVVAGEGPLGSDLRVHYPDVQFVGHVDAATVESLVAAASVCVVPSLVNENAPMSVLEPMAAGVPVVASAIGGIPELIDHGVSGLLVPPGDSHVLAAAIARIQSDASYATALAAAARERVAVVFSPEKHLQSLLGTYAEAIQS